MTLPDKELDRIDNSVSEPDGSQPNPKSTLGFRHRIDAAELTEDYQMYDDGYRNPHRLLVA